MPKSTSFPLGRRYLRSRRPRCWGGKQTPNPVTPLGMDPDLKQVPSQSEIGEINIPILLAVFMCSRTFLPRLLVTPLKGF